MNRVVKKEKRKKRKIKSESYLRQILILAPPMMLQDVIGTSVNMADTMMIGAALGITEIAAVGVAGQLTFFFTFVLMGLTSGTTVFASQYFGDGNRENIHKVMGIGFLFGTLIAALFALPAMVFPTAFMRIFSSDPEVLRIGAIFLPVLAISYFLVVIINTRNGAMRSVHEVKIPMICSVVAIVANVSMNFVTLFVLEWGILAVAVTTVIARLIELGMQEILIRAKKVEIRTSLKNYFDFDFAFVKQFFKVSWFIIFSDLIWAIGFSVFNVAYGILGTDAQGSMKIASDIKRFFQIAAFSAAIAGSILVGNAIGAGKRELAQDYAKKASYLGIGLSIVLGGMLALFSGPLLTLFNLEPHIQQTTQNILWVASFVIMLQNLNYTNGVGILRAGGDTSFMFKLEVATMYLVGVPVALFGSIVLGLPVYLLYLAIHAEEAVRLVGYLMRLFSGKWINKVV